MKPTAKMMMTTPTARYAPGAPAPLPRSDGETGCPRYPGQWCLGGQDEEQDAEDSDGALFQVGAWQCCCG